MPTLQLAHIREQGVDLIIIPLDDSFRLKTDTQRNAVRAELQGRARSAGLAGTVCLVWDDGGQTRFMAPANYHPYFRSISMDFVLANRNRELTW